MIFYNGELIDYKKAGKTREKGVAYDLYLEMEKLRAEYFAKDKKGVIQLKYPRGRRKQNVSGVYEPKKMFLLSLVSTDGMWRWSDKMPTANGFTYKNGNKYKVSNPFLFYEKDIDLVWFLQNHCPQVTNKSVHFVNDEKVAEEKARSTFGDIDLKFALYSGKSPISKDTKVLRVVAETFHIEEASKLGLWELRNAIFEVVSKKSKEGDKYINFEKFDELTESDTKRRAATIVRKYIADDILKYKATDRAWYIHSGGEWITELMKIKITDTPNKDHILLNEVLTNPVFRGKVYAELGVSDFKTRGEVKELGRPALQTMCKNEGIEYEKTAKVDDLAKLYCDKMEIPSA